MATVKIPRRVKKNPRAQASWAKEKKKQSVKRQDKAGVSKPKRKRPPLREPFGPPHGTLMGTPKKRPRKK